MLTAAVSIVGLVFIAALWISEAKRVNCEGGSIIKLDYYGFGKTF